MTDPATHPSRATEQSTAELVKSLTEQLSRLVRDELKLAEYEMTGKAKRLGRGAGMFGGSGLIALYGIGCLLGAAAVAALMGKRQVGKATPAAPEQTVQSVRADVEEIKERAHR
jgi:putative superfamily III holin-X